MKLLKKILIGLAILIVLLLVLAFFMSRQLNITVTEKVDAPTNYAFNILNDFKNQKKWDPWMASDSTMVFTLGDQTSGQGAYVDYKSDVIGEGRTTRVESISNKKILLEATSEDNGDAIMTYELQSAGEATDLTWAFETEIPFPMNLMNFFIDRKMKKEMKQGINNISKLANERWKKGVYDGYKVKQEVVSAHNYVISRDVVSMDQVDKFYTQNLQPLFKKIQDSGVEMEGFSSAIFYNWNTKNMTTDMATAIPIKEEVAISGAGSETLEAGKVATVDFYGNRDLTINAHMAIDDYMKDRGLLYNYPVVEEYVTDPMEEKDQSKWLTKIRYYLAD